MRKTIVYIFVNRYKVTTNKQTKKKKRERKITLLHAAAALLVSEALRLFNSRLRLTFGLVLFI